MPWQLFSKRLLGAVLAPLSFDMRYLQVRGNHWFQEKKLLPLSVKFTHDSEEGCHILETKTALGEHCKQEQCVCLVSQMRRFEVGTTAGLVLWRSVESPSSLRHRVVIIYCCREA